jgi:hypothetical protein
MKKEVGQSENKLRKPKMSKNKEDYKLFNEFDFILGPENEEDLHFYVCQDCGDHSNKPKDIISLSYICNICGSHTLGPFKNKREAMKAHYVSRRAWGIFLKMQDEDGVKMPGFEEYVQRIREIYKKMG